MLYTELATLFLIFLIDVVRKQKCERKDALALFLTGVLASLLRNNGIYAVVPALFLLGFYIGKPFRRTVFLCLLSVLLVYLGFVKVIYPSVLGIENGSVREALTIPFQQTARYVVEHGDEVTEYEKSVIDSVLDYDSIVENYNPFTSDPIKATWTGDNAKLPEYFKVWFQMFLKHPGTYISAALYGAYGYIAPVAVNLEASVSPDWGLEEADSYLVVLGLHRVLDESLAQILADISSAALAAPLVRFLFMPGFYTWLVLLCVMISLRRKKPGLMIILVPELINILVCIASPLANSIRYELPVIAAAPLLIGWTSILTHSDSHTDAHPVPAVPPDAARTVG